MQWCPPCRPGLQVVRPDAPELKSEESLLQQIRELYCSQSVSTTAKAWNDIRERALRDALTAVFIPQFERELRARLTADARELVCSSCCTKVFRWAAQGPLTVCSFISTVDRMPSVLPSSLRLAANARGLVCFSSTYLTGMPRRHWQLVALQH